MPAKPNAAFKKELIKAAKEGLFLSYRGWVLINDMKAQGIRCKPKGQFLTKDRRDVYEFELNGSPATVWEDGSKVIIKGTVSAKDVEKLKTTITRGNRAMVNSILIKDVMINALMKQKKGSFLKKLKSAGKPEKTHFTFIASFLTYPSFLEAINIQNVKTKDIVKSLKSEGIKATDKKTAFRMNYGESFVEFPKLKMNLAKTAKSYKFGSPNLDFCTSNYHNSDPCRHGLAYMMLMEPLPMKNTKHRIKQTKYGGKEEEVALMCRTLLKAIAGNIRLKKI